MNAHPTPPVPSSPAVPTTPPGGRLSRLVVAAALLALFSAAMWFAWLGWDNEYHLVDGEQQGPYRAWQVIGCGAAITAAAVAAYLWVRGVGAVLLLPLAAITGFAVPWTVEAASSDDSGLYAVGLVLLVVGGGVGLLLVLAVTAGVSGAARGARRRRA